EFEEVVGVCGLYTTPDTQHDSVWLNWLCVDPNYRKQGIRRMLLETAIKQAKATGKKFLCLFTSDDPNEAAAQKLYEKYGLKIVRKEKDSTHMTFYRTLRLY
ncbi:MAG: GNAT family N-acetyltransferase, partial [Firmicutes bacterium]|nr:GNAT family N-acetyltransferase [Bacillota bacterium]